MCGVLNFFKSIVYLYTGCVRCGYSMLNCVSWMSFFIHWTCVCILGFTVVFQPASAAFRLLAVTATRAGCLVFRVGVNLSPMEDVVIGCLKQVLACCRKICKDLVLLQGFITLSLVHLIFSFYPLKPSPLPCQ